MLELLRWPLVVLVLGLLALAGAWDFLQQWLRGIRSERQVLAKSLDELKLRTMTLERAWPLIGESHDKLQASQLELAELVKRLDARIPEPGHFTRGR